MVRGWTVVESEAHGQDGLRLLTPVLAGRKGAVLIGVAADRGLLPYTCILLSTTSRRLSS